MVDVAFEMMRELNGLKYIYETTLSDCFVAVCRRFKLDPELQNKEETIQKVRAALSVSF
ncbi:hypothetical protein [Paenibacillus taichungensis]